MLAVVRAALRSVASAPAHRSVPYVATVVHDASHCDRHSLAGAVATNLADFADRPAVRDERRWQGVTLHDLGVTRDADTMFWLDAEAADHLEPLGDVGRANARKLREKSTARWNAVQAGTAPLEQLAHLWVDPTVQDVPMRFIRTLVRTLHDGNAYRVESKHHPALSVAVVERTRDALWSADRHVDDSGDTSVLLDASGRAVAIVDGPTMPSDLTAALRGSRTLVGHRLLRYLVAEGYRRTAQDLREPSIIDIAGGFHGLACAIGVEGGKAEDDVRQTLIAMQCLHIKLPHGIHGGLLTWSYLRPSRRRPAHLRIRLGDPLLPQYVTRLPRATASLREMRALVPLPQRLPPFIGREQDHPAQAVLQVEALVELRRAAPELTREGSVRISRPTWSELGERADLPASLLDPVVERWISGAPDDPARDR
jgi:hypothetical protein